jgi:ribosomal protein S6
VQTLVDKYGVTNISRNKAVLQKKKETWLAKYGVDNPFKMESVKELAGQVSLEERTRRHLKGIKTLQVRYQTDASNAMRVPSIAAKAIASRKRSLINKYGTYDKGLAALAIKTRETYLKRYGTTNMRELDWYIRKMEETYYWRYQVRTSYPTHIADIMEKVLSARYKLRPVTVKKKTYAVRSQLEAEVIEKLLRQYKVTDLTTETREIVTIPYEYQGVSRRYYPDIRYISPIGRAEVAEVKSFYTMGLVPFNRGLIEKNLAKFKAAFKTVSNFVIYLQLPKVGVVRLTTPEEVMTVVRSYRP